MTLDLAERKPLSEPKGFGVGGRRLQNGRKDASEWEQGAFKLPYAPTQNTLRAYAKGFTRLRKMNRGEEAWLTAMSGNRIVI